MRAQIEENSIPTDSTGKINLHHPPLEPRLLRVSEAARYLGATVWFVRSMVWSDAVPHLRLGKRILFDQRDLDEFISREKRGGAAANIGTPMRLSA
jgi:excisionase family DNA binding protein